MSKHLHPTPFIEGSRIYLRALIETDAQNAYPTWFNQKDVCYGNSHHVFPYTYDMAVNYITQVNNSDAMLVLAIILKEVDRHIGNISLQNIHSINRSAEFAIFIGEQEFWGQGYAKEAAKLLLEHAFNTINLQRIYCGTYENNLAMQRLANSLGMQEEGRRRKAVYKDGKYLDMIEFGILRNEFAESNTTNTA